MTRTQFTLFGRTSIDVDGRASRFAPGTAVVLARLILADNHLVTVVELSRALRPAQNEAVRRDHRVAVQKRISELRTLLDPRRPGESSEQLRTDRGATTAYRLVADREQVDVFRFEDLVGKAMTAPPDLAVPLLRQALALWRDRPLLDVEDRPFAAEAIARVTRLRQEAERALALHSQDPEQPAAAPPARSTAVRAAHRERANGSPVPRQLPPPVRGFVGREGETAALTALARQAADAGGTVAISAVDGAAGIGKTAFAVQAAHHVADLFPDGQLYIDLRGFDPGGAALGASEALCAFLAAFQVPPQRIPHDEHAQAGLYQSMLAGRRVLVLLDNARGGEQVRPLLPGAPGCLALVTSRNQLTSLIARGAAPVTLDLFTTAESRLLLTARLGRDRVAADPCSAQDIIAGCARLPLALVIAAARAATHPAFPLKALAAELGDARSRLDALTGRDTATDLRAVFSWSYQALPADLARFFRLLSLHAGPDISAGTAGALADTSTAEARRALTALTGANLLEESAPGRYRFHDLLRIYAAELADAEEYRATRRGANERLAEHYRAHVAEAAQLLYPHRLHLASPDAPPPARFDDGAAALAWLDVERANLVALVVHLAREGHHRAAWGLADLANGYFKLRSDAAGWQAVAEAGHRAALAEGDLDAQAITELHAGMAEANRCRFDEAAKHYTRSVALAEQTGWTQCHAVALNNLAGCHWANGQIDQTIRRLSQALALHRQSGREAGEAVTLANLGVAHMEQARDGNGRQRQVGVQLALRLLTEALALHRKIGDLGNEADTLRLLAEAHREAGDHLHALALAGQALSYVRDVRDIRFEAAAHSTMATIHVRLGDSRPALDHHHQALDLARHSDDRRLQAQLLLDQADSHARLDQPLSAGAELREALDIARQINFRLLEHQAQRVLDPGLRTGRSSG